MLRSAYVFEERTKRSYEREWKVDCNYRATMYLERKVSVFPWRSPLVILASFVVSVVCHILIDVRSGSFVVIACIMCLIALGAVPFPLCQRMNLQCSVLYSYYVSFMYLLALCKLFTINCANCSLLCERSGANKYILKKQFHYICDLVCLGFFSSTANNSPARLYWRIKTT